MIIYGKGWNGANETNLLLAMFHISCLWCDWLLFAWQAFAWCVTDLFAWQSLACLVTGCCLRYRNGFPCNVSRLEEIPSLIAPGFREEPRACIIQTQALLFSCTGTSPSAMRLCPCRKYKKGQVALCDGCWHQSRLIYCGKKISLFSEEPFTVEAQSDVRPGTGLCSFVGTYKLVRENRWKNLIKCRGGPCNGRAPYPGGSGNTPSCFNLQKAEISAGQVTLYLKWTFL